jgi:hypothetical protein
MWEMENHLEEVEHKARVTLLNYDLSSFMSLFLHCINYLLPIYAFYQFINVFSSFMRDNKLLINWFLTLSLLVMKQKDDG